MTAAGTRIMGISHDVAGGGWRGIRMLGINGGVAAPSRNMNCDGRTVNAAAMSSTARSAPSGRDVIHYSDCDFPIDGGGGLVFVDRGVV
jgi:hypothetical protein